MTAEVYRVFYYVADCGSISKAAEQLFVTQPAVSKTIKNLEKELGVRLFKRMARGVALTVEGQVLYNHVKQAFAQLNEGEKLMKQLKERSYGAVRIGISNSLCKYYFLPHLREFHQLYPELKIEIVNRTSAETLKLLDDGRLDCAIISEVAMDKQCVYEKLMTIQDIFVSKNPSPKPVMSLEDLTVEAMLLLEKKNATREHLDKFLNKEGIQLSVDIEISSMEFLIEFAKIGLGIAGVIESFVQEELEAQTLYHWPVVPPVPERSIGLMYINNNAHSIACRTFIDFMLDRKAN